MKGLGSDIFGTREVKSDEYILLAKVMVDSGMTIEEADVHIQCIDDMLGIQKMQLIIAGQRRTRTGKIRKNSAMSDIMSGRLDVLIDDLNHLNKAI